MPYSDFSQNVAEIRKHVRFSDSVEECYKAVYNFMEKHEYLGACHEMSAVMYILMTEFGVDCSLTSGELSDGPHRFDHSWIEIGGKIFDIAVSFTGVPQHDGVPVFADVTVAGLSKSKWNYLEPSADPDQGYVISHSIPFSEYMSGNPAFPNGTFGLVEILGKELGLELNPEDLKVRYADTVWQTRDPGNG